MPTDLRKQPLMTPPAATLSAYLYARRAIRAADPADSHVQARTVPKPAGRSTLAAGFTSAGNDCAGTTQLNPPAHPGYSGTQPA